MLTRRMIERLWFVWLFEIRRKNTRCINPPKSINFATVSLFVYQLGECWQRGWLATLFFVFMQPRGPLFVFGQCWQREWLATLAASQLLFVCSSLENRSKDVCSSSPKPSVWSDLNILISRPFWEQQESDQIIRDNQSLDVSQKIILDRNLDARKTTVEK